MNYTEVLKKLLEGNNRFISGQSTIQLSEYDRTSMAEGQEPFAAIVRCADSRVAPEIVFDQPLGNLFVCGVAGNIPTPEIVESLEYAVEHLGVTLIVVMGHSDCGAVTAAFQSERPVGLFSQIALSSIPDLDECVAHNAEQGVTTMLNTSRVIENNVKNGTLQLVAGVFDIPSGEFELIAQTQLN